MVPLAEVLRRHWPQYERQFGAEILRSHQRAVRAILACRTGALGGQVYRCRDCHQEHYVYHSCQHRACPQCGQAPTAQWVQTQLGRLLPVPYYLITFTVPEGLRAWLRSHQKWGYSRLLQESAGALQDVAQRPKYLGGRLGFLSVLQTWGRQLQYHPHVHCVVPAGGLRVDGQGWCRPKGGHFFLPQIVLAARFRARLHAALHHQPEADQIPAAVWKQKWVVDVQPVGSGEAAIKYLAAYVHHTALGAERILQEEDGEITFQYKERADQQWHPLTVPAMEFLRRFLQHVLPPRFQRVRYYGWRSAAAVAQWERIVSLLAWTGPAAAPPPVPDPPRCPHCGGPLVWLREYPRGPPRRRRKNTAAIPMPGRPLAKEAKAR